MVPALFAQLSSFQMCLLPKPCSPSGLAPALGNSPRAEPARSQPASSGSACAGPAGEERSCQINVVLAAPKGRSCVNDAGDGTQKRERNSNRYDKSNKNLWLEGTSSGAGV